MVRRSPSEPATPDISNALDWEHIILGFKRTTKDFLESIVADLSESFIVSDLDGRIVYYNKGSEKLFGYTAEEILGKNIITLGVRRPDILAEIRKGNTFRGEVVHTRKNGERFPSSVICIPLRDEHGRPMAMVGTARDMTEEKEVNRLKEFSEKVVTSLNDGIQIIDKSGHITFVNRRFEKIIGYEREEILGKHYQSFVAKEVLEKFIREIEARDPAKAKKVVKTTYTTKDNKKVPVLVSRSYLEKDGDLEGMINAVTDITEMKILEEELFQSEKMTLLGKLAGEIAHEINNPLSGLIIATQMLVEDIQAKGRINRNSLLMELKAIENDATRCRRFIEKVLNFSKIIPEEKAMVNIHDVIEDALLLVQRQARLENITIRKSFYETDLYTIGNSNNLQQVIINLVNNAREAILPASGEIILKTYARESDGKRWARIEIDDTGKGIPREIMERIFDSFFTTKPKGTGLGLSVGKRIIEEHGGRLTARNVPGGASFTVSLPVP